MVSEFKDKNTNTRLLLLIFLFIHIVFSLDFSIAVTPFGANITVINSTTAPADAPQSIPAQAGNVTEININGVSTTQTWQGYFGNVTGSIQLADAGNNVLYNWSLASPQGEIYASNHSSISWTNIQCFNFTSNGTAPNQDNETGTAGGTSNHGLNLSQLESIYNIGSDDVDGVDETFNSTNVHDEFFTNNLQFSSGECVTTFVFDSTGQGVDNLFEEVLLYDPNNDVVVFTSILEEADTSGFDGKFHDFEMLVLEDGHGTDTAVSTYYFYVELQ